jgi:hypothetical protein
VKTRATGLYPFVPSGPHFATSIAFFAELGFDKLWEHDGLAGLRFGEAYFLLQNIDVPEWQGNQMITFEVNDLELYWTELEGKRLSDKYSGVRLKQPTDYPWGRELHIIDPGGVCWHIRQAKPR